MRSCRDRFSLRAVEGCVCQTTSLQSSPVVDIHTYNSRNIGEMVMRRAKSTIPVVNERQTTGKLRGERKQRGDKLGMGQTTEGGEADGANNRQGKFGRGQTK